MLLSNLNLLATAPGGVARLRELILTLAVQGKLVPQDPSDEPASELLKKIRAEKDRLISEGKIKRDKPLAGISEGEKPFEVPSGWEWVHWANVAMKIGDIDHKMPSEAHDGVPYISPRDFYGKNEIDFAGAKKISRSDYLELASKIRPEMGDLIYPRYGTIGVVRMVTEEREFLASYSCAVIKVLHGFVEPGYQYLLSMSSCVRLQAASATNKTTQPNVGLKSIQEYVVPLPPLAEQSRIITRVEELMRLCDALEAKGQLEAKQHSQLVATLLYTLLQSPTPEALAQNWQRVATHFDLLLDRPQAVDALEQTILQLAVRGLLVPQDPTDEPASHLLKAIRQEKDRLIAEGKIKRDKPMVATAEDEKPFEVPVGWEWVAVGDVVEMLNGYAFKSEWFKKAGTRLLRNVNVGHGQVDWSAPAFIENSLASEFKQFALNAGDVVLTLDRPIISTGLKLAVLREQDLPCLLLQRVARLSPTPQALHQEFLVLWMQSDAFVGTLDPGRSNGVPHISTKQVASMAFPLPPLPEQSRIVARVEELRRLCSDLRQRLTHSQTVQAQLAEALVAEVA